MFAVCVTFTLKLTQFDVFMPLVKAQARNSLDLEPGCHRFDVCAKGDTIFLYELYDDADAFDAHLATTHFKEFDAIVAGMIATKSVETYTDVTIG